MLIDPLTLCNGCDASTAVTPAGYCARCDPQGALQVRLTRWADAMRITPEAIITHTETTKASIVTLQEAKNNGATDAEMITLATGGTK